MGAHGPCSAVRELMHVVFGSGEPRLRIGYHVVTPGILLEDDYFRVRAFAVEHRGTEAYGFSFEEKSRRPFLPERAQALGVPARAHPS